MHISGSEAEYGDIETGKNEAPAFNGNAGVVASMAVWSASAPFQAAGEARRPERKSFPTLTRTASSSGAA